MASSTTMLSGRSSASGDGIREIMERALSDCIGQIKANSRRAGQVATGRTLRSLERRLEERGTAYVGQILGRKYFGTLETGRGPYAGGKADPEGFNARLIEWMKARGFQCRDEEEYRRMANWLRWRINRFGTRLYRQGGRKDIFTPAVDAAAEFLQQELSALYRAELEDLFTQGFQGFGNGLH